MEKITYYIIHLINNYVLLHHLVFKEMDKPQMNSEVDHAKGRMEEEMERQETTKSLAFGFTGLRFL